MTDKMELKFDGVVDVTPVTEHTDIAGKKVKVYDENRRESFNKKDLDEEMGKADKDIEELTAISMKKYYNNEMAKRTAAKDRLVKIQKVMKGDK